jgi:hypothetical protein
MRAAAALRMVGDSEAQMPRFSFRYAALTQRIDVLVRTRLWAQVLAGLVAGVVVGALLGPDVGMVDRRAAAVVVQQAAAAEVAAGRRA